MLTSSRRSFLLASAGIAAGIAAKMPLTVRANQSTSVALGSSKLQILSDGYLTLPTSFIFPQTLDAAAVESFRNDHGLQAESYQSNLNLTLWQTDDRLVLFDAGAGPYFMDSAGLLVDSLSAAGVDPGAITDVVFTHAHPDHLWGVVDDFDEILFPNASFHISESEWQYWRAEGTLSSVPANRQSFVVGAQSRLEMIEERVERFEFGAEPVPGVEAVDTAGHTPGHTSFVIRDGNQGVMVIGDALTHAAKSFLKPEWASGSDQNPDLAVQTRKRLLNRLAQEQLNLVGFHLPFPGYGQVDTVDGGYQFVAL